MKDRFQALDQHTQWVIILAVGFVIFRTGVASQSGFGFHQGWNEGHYALIAHGFLDHPLVPQYGDNFVYNVPPLFPYSVAASFVLFGESVLAARLPSIFATGGLIVATYYLGCEVFENRSTAFLGTVVLATLPYVQLYGGRAQTDMLMIFLLTASLTAIIRGYRRENRYRRWLLIGAALFAAAVASKQPAIALSGVVFLWLIGNQRFDQEIINRTILLIVASVVFLLPLAGWLYLNYVTAPAAFVADWEHELFSRTRPFANVRLLLAIAFALGVTAPVLAGTLVGVFNDVRTALDRYRSGIAERPGPSILVWWVVLYGVFVFARTPHGHQYYAVVLTPPIALLAGKGMLTLATRLGELRGYRSEFIRFGVLALVLMSTITGTVVLYELSGEFSAANGGGSHVTADASDFVVEDVPDNAVILVPNGYAPPIKWYVRNDHPVERVVAFHPSSLSEQRLRSIARESPNPVYVMYPSPIWGDPPPMKMEPVYATSSYDYTLMTIAGEFVTTDSKFTFYLNDRGLRIYRFESNFSDNLSTS